MRERLGRVRWQLFWPHPKACDGRDNDCDGTTDEAVYNLRNEHSRCSCELKRAATKKIGEPAVWTTWVQPMRPVMALMMIAMAEQMKARVPVGILDVAPK